MHGFQVVFLALCNVNILFQVANLHVIKNNTERPFCTYCISVVHLQYSKHFCVDATLINSTE